MHQAAEIAAVSIQEPLPTPMPRRFRLLSYNIQAGVDTRHYREYLTKGWRHLLPHRTRLLNLNRIAEMLAHYDMVGLQEVDSGSLRSGFVDMTEYLAHRAGFPHWYRQVNRDIGMLAQHSNGFLSRLHPVKVTHHRLPAGPGRGAMLFEFHVGSQTLLVCSMHLALGRRARGRQLEFVSDLVSHCDNLVVMGDLNTGCESKELRRFVDQAGLVEPACNEATFPSWRPSRKIDHILVSPALDVLEARVLDYPLSDHLPISVELELPSDAGESSQVP
jgi:endonuclease/exonuclease/phosphatase family metal-dependent hydrolase